MLNPRTNFVQEFWGRKKCEQDDENDNGSKNEGWKVGVKEDKKINFISNQSNLINEDCTNPTHSHSRARAARTPS